ncbi:uncharacterized protein LOC111036089, partial [Myzus persicae]|uniref:uncharacterized protein LOC111036089 n=1 Tax=Myzus persicae TaxID=13164 RepID=UPI000B933106
MDYFVDTYLNNDACMFDRKIWNHFNTDKTRTTNHLEGWHAALNRSISRPKPNIFLLINEIKNQLEERLTNTKDRLESKEISLLDYIDIIKYHI